MLQNEFQNWLNTLCVVKPYLRNKGIFTFITRLHLYYLPVELDTLDAPPLYFST